MRNHVLFKILCLGSVLYGLPGARAATNNLHHSPLPRVAGFAVALMVVVACIGTGLLAVALLYAVLRPQTVRSGSERLRSQVFRSFIVGILSILLLLLIGANLQFLPKPLTDWLGLAGILLLAYLVVTGFVPAAHCVGENVLANLGLAGTGSDIRKILAGGGLIAAANLLPVVGQLISLLVLVCGLGLVVQDLFRNKKPSEGSNRETDADLAAKKPL
jgi:hypothetical protein